MSKHRMPVVGDHIKWTTLGGTKYAGVVEIRKGSNCMVRLDDGRMQQSVFMDIGPDEINGKKVKHPKVVNFD